MLIGDENCGLDCDDFVLFLFPLHLSLSSRAGRLRRKIKIKKKEKEAEVVRLRRAYWFAIPSSEDVDGAHTTVWTR